MSWCLEHLDKRVQRCSAADSHFEGDLFTTLFTTGPEFVYHFSIAAWPIMAADSVSGAGQGDGGAGKPKRREHLLI